VRLQRWTLVLSGGLMLALVEVESLLWLGVLFFLVGLIGDAFRPAMMVAVTRCSPPELRTRSFALMRLAATVLDRFAWFPVTRDQLDMLAQGNSADPAALAELIGRPPLAFSAASLSYLSQDSAQNTGEHPPAT